MASSSSNDDGGKVNLPLGYHFCPTEVEIIHCIKHKILGKKLPAADAIPIIDDLYSLNPDQIPLEEFEYGMEGEWYFFTRRAECDSDDDKDHNHVVAKDGYWKLPNSSDKKQIKLDDGEVTGYRQTIPFLLGVPPKGRKSNWLIREYRVNPDTFDEVSELDQGIKDKVQSFVICRVKVINKSLEPRIKNIQDKKMDHLFGGLGIFKDEKGVKKTDKHPKRRRR